MKAAEIEKRKVSVLIPYYLKDGDIFIFLQKRNPDAKRLPGYFGFFGGGIEADESPKSGLKREIQEELGIQIENFSHFGYYEFYAAIIDAFSLQVDSEFPNKITISEGEYGKFFSESDILEEKLIIDQDKLILKNFIGQTAYSDPWHFDKRP